jgi:protein-tyrosine kinase
VERLTRATERAFVARDLAHDIDKGPKIAVVASDGAVGETVDYTETTRFKLPVVELSDLERERRRILPPDASGPHAAPYKMLRTQVLRRLDQLHANTLGVVSATEGDGKTLTAVNLAIAIAVDPARTVLLVDFDLRRPGVHRSFGYEPSAGVEECLMRRRSLPETMFKVAGYERITIVSARERCELSSELLSSTRASELVAEMRSRYANRIVIFDLPPVLQSDDALAFSRNLEAALLVVGDGHTRRDDVARSLELLRDVTFVGTVLNGSREPIRAAY